MESQQNSRYNKRLKVGRACYTCRAKKIKCDGLRPCMQCKARGRPCTFYKDGSFDPDQDFGEEANMVVSAQEVSLSGGADRKSDTDLEDPHESCFLFADTKDSSYIRSKRRGPPLESRTSNTLASLGEGLRRVSLHETHTGKTFADAEPFGSFIKWIAEPSLPGRYTGSIEMPPREVQMEMLEFHFTENYETMPIIPKRYFFDQLERKGPFITPLLLNSIYALTSRYISSDYASDLPKAEIFFHRAKRLLDDFMDVPRVSTVVALCYMSLYEPRPTSTQRTGSPYCRAWMYSGMAYRMCLELGLHNQNNIAKDLSPVEIELRKRVFWSCYCLDKLHSVGWERPWMLSTRMTQTGLPSALPEDDDEEQLIIQGLIQKIKFARMGEEAMIIVGMHQPIPIFDHQQPNELWPADVNSSSNKHPDKEKVEYFQNHYWDIIRDLPLALQWTPVTDVSVDQILELPTPRPLVAHLHLHVVHGLLDSYFRSPDNDLNQLKRRILATCITQLVHCMCDRPAAIIKLDSLIHMLLSAIKVHVRHLYNNDMHVARQAWAMFDRSIHAIHRLRKLATIPNSAKFLQHLGSSVEGYDVPQEILTAAISGHPPPPSAAALAEAAAQTTSASSVPHAPLENPSIPITAIAPPSDELHTLGGGLYSGEPASASNSNMVGSYGERDGGYVVPSMNQQDWNPGASTLLHTSPSSTPPSVSAIQTTFVLGHCQQHPHPAGAIATDILSTSNTSTRSTDADMICLQQPQLSHPASSRLYATISDAQPPPFHHDVYHPSQILSQSQQHVQQPSLWDFEQ